MTKRISIVLTALLMCFSTSFAAKKVAFLYEEGYNAGKATTYGLPEGGYVLSVDPVYAALSANFDVTPFNCPSGEEVNYEELQTYDCVVVSEAISGNKTMSNNLVKLVGTVPMVSMKAYNYTSGRWSWAKPNNPGTKCNSIAINAGFEGHALFEGLTKNSDGTIDLYDPNQAFSSNRIQGFATSDIIAGSVLETETDKLMAVTTTGDNYNCVHEIATAGTYSYILVGMSSDNIWAVNENGQKIIVNAVNYLTGNKDIEIDEKDIIYLYDSGFQGYPGLENDPINNETKLAEINTSAIDIKDFTEANVDTLLAFEQYDALILSPYLSASHPFVKLLGKSVNRMPMLNFNTSLNDVWGLATAVNPTVAAEQGGVAEITIGEAFLEDALFADVTIEEGKVVLFNHFDPSVITFNLVQAYSATEDQWFFDSEVLATVANAEGTALNAIHRCGVKNTYLMLPLSYEAMVVEGETNLSSDAIQLINNAIDYVAETKGAVSNCAKPSMSVKNSNLVSTVTLSTSTDKAVIYYTTDESEPTEASTLYTGSFDVTVDSTVIKAIAVKQGANPSPVYQGAVSVMAVATEPTFDIRREEGKSFVTLACASPDAKIYYNFVGNNKIESSAEYTGEPIEFTQPVVLTAFSGGDNFIASSTVTISVAVTGINASNIRLDTLAHFDANEADWSWETPGGSSKVAYYIGKSATSIYTQIDTIVSENKQDTTYNYHYAEDSCFYAKHSATNEFNNGWFIKTKGQVIQWEKQTPIMEVGNGRQSYYAESVEDMLNTPSSHFISFGAKISGEPYSAAIQSVEKFKGPFDIILFIGNNNSDGSALKLELAVSADKENWTAVDTLSFPYYKRYWKRQLRSYEGTDEVYVRVMQAGGGTKAVVYDILLLNNGENSKNYTALESQRQAAQLVSTEYYNLNGMRMVGPAYQGITIVKKLYSDGSIAVEKIFMK